MRGRYLAAMSKTHPRLPLVLLLALLLGACSDKEAGDNCAPSAVPKSAKGVAADLAPQWTGRCETGAWLRKVANASELIGGDAAQGRVGDWSIGNKQVRFIIQADDRHSGPCPWGGNVIDADVVRAKGAPGHDNMGEYCLLLNLGRTFRGTDFEVLNSGASGGPAILAVSGADTLLDFINLPSLVGQYLPVPIKLPFDAEVDLPVLITRYYILPPTGAAMTVITAIRNDGDAQLNLAWGEIIDSGGQIQFFNPASSLGGFGYKGFGAEKMDFLAFRGAESSHAFAPTGESLAASYLAISGVAGILLGTDNAMALLTAPAATVADDPATVKVAAGATATRTHLVLAGSGDLGSLTGDIWRSRGVATGKVRGLAVDEAGGPLAGLRISAVDGAGAAWTQFLSDDKGEFGGELPAGSWTFSADAPGRLLQSAGTANVVAGQTQAGVKVAFGPHGGLEVNIRDALGKPGG